MDMWMAWMVTKCPVGRNQGNKKVLGNVTVKVGDAATIWGPTNLLIVLGLGGSSADERVHKALGGSSSLQKLNVVEAGGECVQGPLQPHSELQGSLCCETAPLPRLHAYSLSREVVRPGRVN